VSLASSLVWDWRGRSLRPSSCVDHPKHKPPKSQSRPFKSLSRPSRKLFIDPAPTIQMTVLKARSRMISVRLSEEEYSALVNLCSMTGARSVSDLARDGLRLLVSGPGGDSRSKLNADGLQAQIQLLNRRIDELYERIMLTRAQELKSQLGD
jgi:hypothetical protein